MVCTIKHSILPDKIEGEERSGQGLKRKQKAKNSSTKRKATLKEGKIESDKLLMEIAREIGGKWEEVGVALDIDFKVLRSVAYHCYVIISHFPGLSVRPRSTASLIT